MLPGTRYTDDAGHERFIPARSLGPECWGFDDAPAPGHRPCDESCPSRGADLNQLWIIEQQYRHSPVGRRLPRWWRR